MLSFSDIKRYINDSPAVVRFKPWWEIFLDMLLVGLFLLMALSWTRAYSEETSGIACIPTSISDVSGFSSGEIRYIQSRCHMESTARSLVYYPYILFIQWCLLFLCQVSWIWIPSVVARLMFFHHVFNDILAIQPLFVYNPNNRGILPELDYSDENREKLKIFHDKITFMLMDSSSLSATYRRKVRIVTVILIASIIWSAIWVSLIKFMQVDFECSLAGGPARKTIPLVSCNMSPNLFIYGVMVLHILILLLMLLLSLVGLYWNYTVHKRIRNESDRLFGEVAEDYKGLPGFQDLAFLLGLIKRNIMDGKFTLSTILYVLSCKYGRSLPDKENTMVAIMPQSEGVYSFPDEWHMVTLMLHELGLKMSSYEQSRDRLYSILQDLSKHNTLGPFQIEHDIKSTIRQEILAHLAYYASLVVAQSFSGRRAVSNDDTFLKIRQWLEDDAWPNHLILAAAANLFDVVFFLVSVDLPNPEDVLKSDVIRPMMLKPSTTDVILVYVNPHYYYPTEMVVNPTPGQLQAQQSFLCLRTYRDKLRQKAVRKVATAKNDRQEYGVMHRKVKVEMGQTAFRVQTEVTTKFASTVPPSFGDLHDNKYQDSSQNVYRE